MARIGLNPVVRENYAFFCPESRLHLTRSNPIGVVDRVTSSILSGLRAKSLVDIDGVIDLKTGQFKNVETETPKKEEVKAPVKEEPKVEDKVEEVKEEKEPATKKGRKKAEE